MKLLIAIGAAAVLTAACSASASVSGQSSGTVTGANTVQISSGANAGSDVQGQLDVNRVNPPSAKAGTRLIPGAQVTVPVVAGPAAPGQPSQNSGSFDRCGPAGFAGAGAGNRAIPGSPRRPPLPMCAPE